jgi:hypothetical protein
LTRIRYRSKPVWHETGLIDASGRPYCVAETPASLLVRLKGTRQVLALPWSLAYLKAAWLEAARIRLEKINARKARKKARAA